MPGKCFVAIAKISKAGHRLTESYEALSFGVEGEVNKDILLRRGRATLFKTYQEAVDAIEITRGHCALNKHEWPKHFVFFIVPCIVHGE